MGVKVLVCLWINLMYDWSFFNRKKFFLTGFEKTKKKLGRVKKKKKVHARILCRRKMIHHCEEWKGLKEWTGLEKCVELWNGLHGKCNSEGSQMLCGVQKPTGLSWKHFDEVMYLPQIWVIGHFHHLSRVFFSILYDFSNVIFPSNLKIAMAQMKNVK